MVKRHFSGVLAGRAFIAGALLAGTAWAGDVRVTDAWSRPTPPGSEVGVAYFVITNDGQDDRLMGASSPVAERAELHRSVMQGGVMKMEHLRVVEVKRGEPTVFSPNGRHVMLLGLKRPLKAGDELPLTLKFEKAGSVTVRVHVGEMAAKGRGGQKKGDSHADHSKMKH